MNKDELKQKPQSQKELDWRILFSHYYQLTHVENDYYKKDLLSNYKFIFKAISQFRQTHLPDEEIYNFLVDAIDIHMRIYGAINN